jgi:hypothetical protein
MQAEASSHAGAVSQRQAERGTDSESYMQECGRAGAFKQAHKQKSKDR